MGKTSIEQKADHPSYLRYRRDRIPGIYVFWHKVQLCMAYAHRFEHVNVLVSQSHDGEYVAQVMKNLGLDAVRGSTSQGGMQAFRRILRLLKFGKQVGFTPDGPRGPVQTVHDGVIASALSSGAPLLPVMASSRFKMTFNSWDRFELPLPFGHTVVAHGKPLFLNKHMDHECAKNKLRSALNELESFANQVNLHSPSWTVCVLGRILFWTYNVLSLSLSPLWLMLLLGSFGFKRAVVGIKERFCVVCPPALLSENKPRIWFHAASVGEWQALRPIINQFIQSQKINLVVTTTTHEAQAVIKKENPLLWVHLLPVDLWPVMSLWINKINPSAVVLSETELWPNLIVLCNDKNIPIFISNGRLSARSVKRWKIIKPLISFLLRKVSFIFSRSKTDAEHFNVLGAYPFSIATIGNTKSDNLNLSSLDDRASSKQQLFGLKNETLIIIGGSTWPGEEEALLSVINKPLTSSWHLILAPRRPERWDEIKQVLSKQAFPWSLWSEIKKSAQWTTRIMLVDTLGDLKDLYRAADLAFIGGSLFPKGGQNPLEPLASGVPIVFGPHMENFFDEKEIARQVGAGLEVHSESDLVEKCSKIMCSPGDLQNMAAQCVEVIRRSQGSSKRIVDALLEQLSL